MPISPAIWKAPQRTKRRGSRGSSRLSKESHERLLHLSSSTSSSPATAANIISHYQLGESIGKGQYGTVYKAFNLETGEVVAVKRMNIDAQEEDEIESLMKEVELLKHLSHPNIVRYEGFVKCEGHLNIILEYMENGSLLTTLRAFGVLSERLAASYVLGILEGLIYLHDREVVHCDLKAANLLTTKDGNVKLSDFGVSLNLKLTVDIGAMVAGTPNWMAPEVIELKGASTASDIWSLGCTVMELVTGRPPYDGLLAMTTLFRIVEDEGPPIPEGLSPDLMEFLTVCFLKDPTQRPTARTLMHHPWLKGGQASRKM
ncbi:kinase-like domain-containing protein, partial [Piptocephalis cylindrospora]